MTTLTREALLGKGKPRYAVVEVPGVGSVGVRSVSEVRKTQRESRSVDENGKVLHDYHEKVRAWAFIDQLMVDGSTPMFSESDLEAIQQMDHAVTRPLFQAIKDFNREDEDAGKKDESAGSSEN